MTVLTVTAANKSFSGISVPGVEGLTLVGSVEALRSIGRHAGRKGAVAAGAPSRRRYLTGSCHRGTSRHGISPHPALPRPPDRCSRTYVATWRRHGLSPVDGAG